MAKQQRSAGASSGASDKAKPGLTTHEQLVSKLSGPIETIEGWIASLEPVKHWPPGSDRKVKVLDQGTCEAIEAIEELVLTNDFDTDAYRLVLSIDAFVDEYHRWLDELNDNPFGTNPSGTGNLWERYGHVKGHFVLPSYPKPEPLKELIHRQKLSPIQAAYIYNFRTSDGGADVAKVHEELEKPGTHYQPDKWIHPSKVAEDRVACELWASRVAKRGGARGRVDVRAPAKPKESIEELLRQGVGVAQIADMHKCSPGEVLHVAHQSGISTAPPPEQVIPVSMEVAHQNRMENEDRREREWQESQKGQSSE